MSKLREEYHNETGLSPVRFIQQYGGQATFEDGFTEHYGEWLEQKLEPVEVDYEVNKIIADIVIINTGVETDKAMNPKKYHKVFDQWKKFNGMIIGKLNDLKIKSHASQSEENDLKHLYKWLMDDNREPAQTKFTSGMLRNVAKEIEFRLREKVLSDMMKKDEELGLYDGGEKAIEKERERVLREAEQEREHAAFVGGIISLDKLKQILKL